MDFFQNLQALRLSRPVPAILTTKSENCDYCPYHASGKNSYMCFDASEQEDTMYMWNAFKTKDALDCCYTGQSSEQNYMCISTVGLYGSNFCNISWFSQNLEYCEYVFNSHEGALERHDCFGCVSRNHGEYEILNQKYSKNEYFKRVAEIKDKLKKAGTYGKWWWESPYEAPGGAGGICLPAGRQEPASSECQVRTLYH